MQTETAITERLRRSNTEFRALEESHHRLDAELADLQRRHVLTPAEEVPKNSCRRKVGHQGQDRRIHSSLALTRAGIPPLHSLCCSARAEPDVTGRRPGAHSDGQCSHHWPPIFSR